MAPYSMLYTYLFNEGDFERAIEVTNKQISHNDTTASIYLRRGDAFQRAELFDEAMEDYIKVLSMDSSMYGVHYQIGRLAAVSGTKLELGEESIKKFNSKSELFDEVTLAWAHFRLGTIYEHKKENELAKREYEITLQLDKNHQEAKQALARLN
jgi:tetratricopeptide (TPR) repeat protein